MSNPQTLLSAPCRRWQDILSLQDLEPLARQHLPAPVFGYIASAADSGQAMRSNALAFEQFDLLTRVLRDVSQVSTETQLLGQTFRAPIGIAPVGLSALSAYRGDLVLAQAASAHGLPMIMSGSSLIAMEEVARQSPQTWFQAYLPGQMEQVQALIERVKHAGFSTLVITVDTQAQPKLEFARRSGFSAPLRPSVGLAMQGLLHPRWLLGTFLRTIVKHGMPHFENNYAHRGAAIVAKNVTRDFSERGRNDWKRLQAIRDMWPGRLVIKGILHPDDAQLACAHGADGLIVSNHGGRQLDSAPSPLRMLPHVVKQAGKVPVMLDGGIRRGTDVVKALALGAQLVFVGRPCIYAAALGGAPAVALALQLLRDEMTRAMAMMGTNHVHEISPDCLLHPHAAWAPGARHPLAANE
ncbi:alpha-hydroxy-acid oxidizing protein [Lampropedia puyangensis]|uniref:Alpha-hydroxy-acid oxidizing protein n=1 Tax=Lampropedia puyangensis TaxID=1330072 RepID=A0A4S8FDJ4_9BURK|nr:alpha-hydroxy acid oxidase [Lampropedia puyangensis]THU05055.1 alpha-hydroxy-acid oxidizing protein [Lampropedia puyangensis]